MKKIIFHLTLALVASYSAFAEYVFDNSGKSDKTISAYGTLGFHKSKKMDTATFATGCFWCTEAQFKQLRGVKSVVAGYTGGHVKNPSYKEVCTGTIIYDPSQISYDELLAAFFTPHDPTQLNRQGNGCRHSVSLCSILSQWCSKNKGCFLH